jgi:hypothetical protein
MGSYFAQGSDCAYLIKKIQCNLREIEQQISEVTNNVVILNKSSKFSLHWCQTIPCFSMVNFVHSQRHQTRISQLGMGFSFVPDD